MKIQEKLCAVCGTKFFKKKNCSKNNWRKAKYCSRECCVIATSFKKGSIPANKGKKMDLSVEMRKRMSENAKRNIGKETKAERKKRMANVLASRIANGRWLPPMLGKKKESSPNWKGENATYNAVHRWVQKHYIKKGICEDCGFKPISKAKNRTATHWHNESKKYLRNRIDWEELCPSCHYKRHH